MRGLPFAEQARAFVKFGVGGEKSEDGEREGRGLAVET
jgi:hypothetical protein